MVLNAAKRTALLQLINCTSSSNVETIKQLHDGKLFCDIIETVFPETEFELLAKEKQIIVNSEGQSKDERLYSNIDFKSDHKKMLCEDSKIKTKKNVKKDLEPVQKSDTELNKSAVSDSSDFAILPLPSKPASESVAEQVDSSGCESQAFTKSSESIITDEPVESAVSNAGCFTEPLATSGDDNELVIRPVKFSGSGDISKRYRLIQHFIDVRYNLKSEKVITYSECWNENELQLAVVLAFILSEVVRHYVHVNNPVIQTLSLLDIKVQQDLEECFNYFINERSKITKEEIITVLSNPAPYKNLSSPNRSYFATPRRSCSSKYRRCHSPSISPLEESVYTDSPLKTYFESPIFTRADIVSREKEILKIRQILFEEETKSYSLQQKLQDLERKLMDKDKEINNFKAKNRMLQEDEKSKECEECTKLLNTIQEKKRRIEELDAIVKENYEEARKKFEDVFLDYQVEVAEAMSGFHYNLREAEKEIRQVSEELEQTKKEKNDNEEMVKKLTEELAEKTKELEVYKEKLSDADTRFKDEPKSPVFGECIGGYFKEEGKFQIDVSQIKLEVQHPEERSVKDVMVQCPEQETAVEYDLETDVLMLELPASGDVSNKEKFQNLNECSKNVKKECPDVCDVLNGQDASSKNCAESSRKVPYADDSYTPVPTKQCTDSPSKEVPCADNNYPPVPSDGFGSLWHQYSNSFSENENADGASCVDNGLAKALSILQEAESELNQMMKHLSTVSKTSSGPNGSNGIVGCSPLLKEFLESLKKSVRKSVVCLSQTGETQVKFQNNNSISKDSMVDECGGSSNVAAYSKCFECLKVGSDLPNSIATVNQDNSVLLEKSQEIDSLKEKYKIALKSRNLKEKELENCKKKYSHLRSVYQDSFRNSKEIELKYQKLEMELKDARKREIDTKRDGKREKSILKMQIREIGEKYQKLQNCVLSCQMKVKNMNDENKKLREEISAYKIQNEELSVHIKYLEKKVEDSNVLPEFSSTSNSAIGNKALPSTEGIKEEYTLLENTSDDFLKPQILSPSLYEVSSLDTGNESMKSGALCNKSLHSKSGFHLVTDDEESFINHRSLAEIKKKFDSADVQSSIRLQELRRRNTLYPYHLQSCYPAEGVAMTPAEKKLSKLAKEKKNNVFTGKKRKVSETEAQNQSSQTPTVKTKRRFLETPTSLKKWRLYRRNQRPGSIKPKP